MKSNQNVIVAIVLSFIVLMGWNYFVTGPQMEAQRQRQAVEQEKVADAVPGTVTGAQSPAVPGAPAAPAVDPLAPVVPSTDPGIPGQPAASAVSRDAVVAAGERVRIETPSLVGSINLTGGRIDDLLLADYHVTVDPSSPLVELFSPIGTERPYFAEVGFVPVADPATGQAPAGIAVPTSQTLWQAEGGPLAPGHDVTLTYDNGAGLTFRRVFSIDENFLFTIRQSVENTGSAPVALTPYGLVSRSGLPPTSGYYILHEGLIGYFGEGGLSEIDYDEFEDVGSINPPAAGTGWVGITDKYWAAALVPPAGGTFQPNFRRIGTEAQPTFQSSYFGEPVTVAPGATAEATTRLFAGAKVTALLDRYSEDLGIAKFDLLIDWGWFFFITKPIFKLIDWLYRILGNFGLAILAVTVIVKAVFFPLANRSYASMSKMKKLQPEMIKLQERYKDDRMALQKGMMDLYKTEKVNPVAGCWPILIQIPVFFALYKVLFVTIEMRHAPFFGWIKDLSAPDPSNFFTLLGLIPWSPPTFLHLGIWPLLMGITMFVQMRMNPTPPDKTQAMIFNWMPVFFTFMLAGFPAGLVIYWAWNNFLSVLQQGLIMRRHGVPIELFGNLKGMFNRKPKDNPAE